MECSICFEKFFYPTSREDLEKYIKNARTHEKLEKMISLIITPDRNHSYSCPTPNCNCLICLDCFNKITGGNNNDYLPKVGDYFTCPFCRQIDYKNYFENNVLNELQEKVLGFETFTDLYAKKCLNM